MRIVLVRKLRPGDPLPTVSEPMADLGVGRHSVREALQALRALDIVEIRHGYGTYVGQASPTPFVDGLTFRTLVRPDGEMEALGEILQVREVLEEGLIRRVAVTPAEPDPDRLEAGGSGMEAAAREGYTFPELDPEFHALLYRNPGTALVPRLLGAFRAVFRRVTRARDRSDAAAPRLTARRHRDIGTALRARDRRGRGAGDGEPFPGRRGAHGGGTRRAARAVAGGSP